MKRSADWQNYYKIAQTYLKVLIDSNEHDLNPSFYNHFKSVCELYFDRDGYGESLFEIGWAGGSAAVSGEAGYHMGPKANASSSTGSCIGAINLTPNYYLMFDQQKDTRFEAMVADYEILADDSKLHKSLTTLYPGKIRRDWRVPVKPGTSNYLDMNWPYLRYSDALLMYAEVENELNGGPTAEAAAALEKVRRRAYANHPTEIEATPAGYQEFFEAIVKERALELASEGVRKYDLLRWNRLHSALQGVYDAAIQIRDGVPPYDTLPDYFWCKYENGQFVKRYDEPAQIPDPDPENPGGMIDDPEWTRVAWRKAIDDSFLTNLAIHNFVPGQSELYPFGTATLTANPKLVQDFGY